MDDKREHARYPCKIKANFEFYEGDPATIDLDTSIPIKSKGIILDISKGGLFIVSNSRVGINNPVRIFFKSRKNKYEVNGSIVRTGLIKNNPSELARKYANKKIKEDSYIAVKFNNHLEQFNESEL